MDEEKNNIQVLFGNNVQKYRKKAGFTQDELSERVGITQKHLSIIETGTQFASAQVIEKISKELQVSPAELFGGDMNMKYVNVLFSRIAQHIDMKIENLYARLSADLSRRTS